MKNSTLFIIFLLTLCQVNAQQFIDKARVEYEVTSNLKKEMGNGAFSEMLKENIATFKVGYYMLSFADNKSIYKFDHWQPNMKVPSWWTKSDEDNIWFTDYNKDYFSTQKNLYGTNLIITDSLKDLEWKLTNENRMIAGFNCRKAVAKIFDSVYVFAFYTDEILLTGGPASINGLPGLILGVTIPRLFTSWIATKVMLSGVDENAIKPMSTKKPFTTTSLYQLLVERTKDWYSDDEEDKKEINEYKSRLMWRSML